LRQTLLTVDSTESAASANALAILGIRLSGDDRGGKPHFGRGRRDPNRPV